MNNKKDNVPERIAKAIRNGVGSYYVCPAPDDASNREVEYARVHSPTGPTKQHEFLRYPLGQFRKPENDLGKCWHVLNMLFCGLPADAEIHQVLVAPTGKVGEGDRELVEAVAMPWICVEEKPCEETQAVHWEEMLTSLTAALATVRKEAAEAERRRLALVVQSLPISNYDYRGNTPIPIDLFKANVIKALEAAANGEAKGGDDG